MEKKYCKPQVQWVPIRPERSVAATCWGWAPKGVPIYHDVPGYGYAEVYLTKGGCGKAKVATVNIISEHQMTDQERADAEAWFRDHLTQKMAEAGNNMANFTGQGFSESPDPNWS